MDPQCEEQRVLAILRGGEGWDEEYPSLFEFIHDLHEEADMAHKVSIGGCVLYNKHEQLQQQQISTLLINFASRYCDTPNPEINYLVQFWGVTKAEGSHHYLSTSRHPFCFRRANKGSCWYRKLCRNHVYVVDVGAGDDEDEHRGGVGRVYRNKHLESTPDLRLYSAHQFPMRDEAARCGFRDYMALPIFDFHTSQCYGVLEMLRSDPPRLSKHLLSTLDRALKRAGLKSIHSFVSIRGFPQKTQLEGEIREILELVVATVPRLYLAQVWVPCQQCLSFNTNLCCMELVSFITSANNIVNVRHNIDIDMLEYLDACEFHNLQVDLGSFTSSNLCDVSISKNSLAHFSQRARISHSFVVSLESLNNNNPSYFVQFFLQPKFRQDAYGDNSLHLLLRILEMNLKSFHFVLWGQLLEESQKPIECEAADSLKMINSCKQKLSESNFTSYLKTVDSCCYRPSPNVDSEEGWVFCSRADERLLVHVPIKEKVETFMKNIAAVNYWGQEDWIVQFWAPKMEENKCYLQTSDQPYVVGCLTEGLASFRKKCMTHHYVVDEEAKEEELGPPGRVFKNGLLEITPDLFHYTTKEFPIRNHAMHCCTRSYLALPIFDDQHNHKCVGVLEFLGSHYFHLKDIRYELQDAKLCSAGIGFHPRLEAVCQTFSTFHRMNVALTELIDVLKLMCNSIPQLHMANIWAYNGECGSSTDSNMSYMKLVFSSINILKPSSRDYDQAYWIEVQDRKGMIGMVLASENKSCFCRSLCEFSIVDQPLSHFEMRERCDVCFAICLQSSHTDGLLYVVEFFMYPGPTSYEYLRSILNFLLPIMKDKLKSFKMACGKELGEELVIEVIEFSEANKLGSSESEQPDVFPIKFSSVQYTQKGHQHTEEKQREEHIVAASDLNRREKGKRKTGLHLNLEALKPHFGKKLKDVEEELGVGRSTIKRACREYGIDRWPSKQKYNKNPSLFERGREMQPSTSNLQPVEKFTESSDHVVAEEEAEEKVIVKVKYKVDIIKFDSYVSLRLATLIEEVATRLKLEKGSFKLKYLDEDGDEILLTIDKDLQHCPRSRTATGKTCIQLFVC